MATKLETDKELEKRIIEEIKELNDEKLLDNYDRIIAQYIRGLGGSFVSIQIKIGRAEILRRLSSKKK